MTTQRFATNLRCAGCVETVRPHLDAVPGLKSWSIDTDQPGKPLTVSGDAVSVNDVRAALKKAGYELLDAIADENAVEPKSGYLALVLLLSYLLGATFLIEFALGTYEPHRAARHFMGGFFLVFSFFKLLDLSGFAATYRAYDVIAARWSPYGYIYPFLELLLGAGYLANLAPTVTNVATVLLMAVGTVGVVQTLFAKKKVRCACLGSVINLPVATVTLLEDAGMGVMALVMLLR